MSAELLVSKVAGFLQLDEQLIQGIDHHVLSKVEEKLEDLRKEKSENLKISATLEQLKSQSENKLENVKVHVSQLLKEVEDAKNERLSYEEEKRLLIDEKSDIQKKYTTLERSIEAINQQKELAEASKQDLVKLLDRRNEELDFSKSKVTELLTANKELRQKLADSETELQTQKTSELRLKGDFLRTEQEVALLKGNNDWLSGELNTKTSQLNEFREATIQELQDARLKLSNLESELEIAQNSNQKLKQSLKGVQDQFEQQVSDNKRVKDEFSFSKQEFTKEMSLKQRMIDALEKHMESLKKEMDVTKRTIESTTLTHIEKDDLLEELDDVKSRLKVSESDCIKLREAVDELTSNTKLEDSDSGNLTFSPESSISAVPKLYADLGILKKQLIIERRQKDELKAQVEAFVVELEHKIPVLNSFKERTGMLERELNEITILLESTGKERDQKSAQLTYLKSTVKSYETQISSLSKQRADLARQVQFLLINQSIKAGNDGPLTADEVKFVKNLVSSEENAKSSDTQAIITDRLVEFRSVIELQQKNSELLSTIRNLADELERKEADSKSQIQLLEDETVKEAKETILALHDHAQNLENQLVIISKERDAFKTLSSNVNPENSAPKAITYPSPDNDNRVKDLETRLTAVIKEAENNSKEWSSENSDLHKRFYEISLKFESEKTSRVLAEDRLHLLQSTLELSKSQCEELQKRSSNLQDILTKQDRRTQETVDSLIKTKSDLSSLQSEFSILKSEKQFMAKVQKDLKKENERFSKECLEYKVLVAQLQALQRERETLLKETQESYKEKLEKLETELADTIERLEENQKNTEDSADNKEYQYKWFQEQIDKLNHETDQQRSLLEEKETQIQNLQSTVNQQTAKLKEFQARADSYAMLNNVDDAQNLVETLRQKLEETNLQLSDAYSRIEHHRALEEQSAKSVNEVSEAYQEAQREAQTTINSLTVEKNELKNTISILNDQIIDLNNEIAHQKSEYQKERNSSLEKINELQVYRQSVDEIKSNYDQKLTQIQKDLELQTQYANENQRSYELELQKHADVSKTITALRTEAQSYKNNLETLRDQSRQAVETLKINEGLLEEERTNHEEQLSALEQKIEELSVQNNLLYDQLELLNKTEDSDHLHDSNDLLISLRRERDVLETKLEVAISEQGVLRQRLKVAKSDIESLNSQLAHVNNSSAESAHLIEQHETIMKELDQLHLLRESNVTLRSENNSFKQECENYKIQLSEYKNKVAPLESTISSLQSTLKIKQQELDLSKEESERWKKRSQDILHKYERIDPEEHGKLKEEIDGVKKELQTANETLQTVVAEKNDWESKFQRIRLQARDRINASKEKEQSLLSEINDIKEAKSHLESDLEQSKEVIKNLEEKLQAITQDAETKERDFNAQLSKLQEDLHNVQVEMENGFKEQSAITDADEKIKSLSGTIDALKNRIQELETEASHAQELLTEGHTAVIPEDTKAIVAKLKEEFEAEKDQLIKTKEEELKATFEAEKEHAWELKEKELRKEFEEREIDLKKESESKISELTSELASEPTKDANLESFKAEWEKEYEIKTLERIKTAEEALKKRIRLPTQEKIDKIVEARKAVLEESFEEKVNEKAQRLAAGSEKDMVTLETHRAELNDLKESLRREFESELAEIKQKAFEEGKQQVSLKMKFLESKIKNLESQKNATVTSEVGSSGTNSVFQPPVFGSVAAAASPFAKIDTSPNKRPSDEVTAVQPEKRLKESNNDTESQQEE